MSRPVIKDITGKVFGRLTVLKFSFLKSTGTKGMRSAHWLCKCECGVEKPINGSSLRAGKIISCGCYNLEKTQKLNLRHGEYLSPEYVTYKSMKERCNNEKGRFYYNYGGRGIKVCERWLESYQNFLEDMGRRPSLAYSLDRIDNEGNYEPSNCRWATKKQQGNNTRDTVFVTMNGKTKSLTEWAEELGINRRTLYDRRRKGLTGTDILTFKSNIRCKKATAF